MINTQSAHNKINTDSRQKIYGLLSSVFLQNPTDERLAQQKELLHPILQDKINWDALLNDVGAVEQAFYDCFFVPTSGCYVPPYESALLAYTDTSKKFGKLNGPSASHIAHSWKETGFMIGSVSIYEPLRQSCMPDHIGLQLAFMTFLCGAELNSLETVSSKNEHSTASKWKKYQLGFMKDHLHNVIGTFAQALNEIAPGYYATIASFAAAWVETDYVALDSAHREG